MAKSVKNKANFQLILNTSIAMNMLSILAFFIIAYKYYRLSGESAVEEKNSSGQESEAVNPSKRRQKAQNEQLGQQENNLPKIVLKLNDKNTSKSSRQAETSRQQQKMCQQEKELVKRKEKQQQLKHELQLEQDRGRFLQEQIDKLQQSLKLNQARFTALESQPPTQPSHQSAAISDLRNQLQFCQKRLLVSQNSEKELRLKLQEYQKVGEYSLHHPEYIRMRQMNIRYKQTIASLQTYLLEKNQIHPNLNISFGDL